MFLRLRWLTLGMVLALSGGAVVVTRMVRLRRAFTADNVTATVAGAAADVLEWMAEKLRGSTTPQG